MDILLSLIKIYVIFVVIFIGIPVVYFLILELFAKDKETSEAFKTQEPKEKAANFSHSSRITHCFNCKCTLNSSVDNKCWWCGWLKCKCSACGCNYKRY